MLGSIPEMLALVTAITGFFVCIGTNGVTMDDMASFAGTIAEKSDVLRHPVFPKWPASYRTAFKFYVPYLERYQSGPLKYDMKFLRFTKLGLQRVVRDDSEIWIERGPEDLRWYVTPANMSAPGCLCETMSDGNGPTRRLLEHRAKFEELLSPALPTVEAPTWELDAHTLVTTPGGEQKAFVWRYSVTNNGGYGTVTTSWKFTITGDGVPVKLDMWGENWFTGGHWDHYIAEFYDFEANPKLDKSDFDVPKLCDGVMPSNPDVFPLLGGHHLTQRLHDALSGLLPSKFRGDGEYDAHAVAHGRAHAHRAEYERRRGDYLKNKAIVDAHNGEASSSFVTALNHLADWSEQEYRALFKAGSARTVAPKPVQPRVHKPTWPLHMLPSTVDWRGSPADSIVKDQSMCGSCWAFAAVAPMEAAYYRHFGKLKLLSEQYLMDCSWEYGNTGCNGGEQPRAFSFVVANGGIPTNEDYPYEGVNMPCERNGTRLAAAFSAYVNVEAGNREHLKEALLTKGPMTVSLDAGDPAFRFYKSGIFRSTVCKSKPLAALDHAVMVSGYGREPSGEEWWLVKNIWTTYWGEGGYVRIDMDHDCGVATLPEYVELDVAKTKLLAQQSIV